MTDPKTRPTGEDVSTFLASIQDAAVRADSRALVDVMGEVTGDPPRMWGGGMVGFGRYHARYASGREGEWPKVGFAPRARQLTVYLMSGLVGYEDLLDRLGRHRTGKSCLYLRRLDDVDRDVLTALIERAVRHLDQVEEKEGGIPRMSEMPPPEGP